MLSKIIGFLYKNFLKRLFFLMDPEVVHDNLVFFGRLLGMNVITKSITKCVFAYENPMLNQDVLGIKFINPIGLSAGFDKNAHLTEILPAVGFGFAEVGSITGEQCEGNPKPRLWRLKESKSLLVYYGLKNDGCEVISKRLKSKKFEIPIGINIAKTNCELTVDTKEGIKDYLKAYETMQDIGSYITLNVSCPNAFGGQPFTTPEKLDALLNEVFKIKKIKPVLIKLSPDIEFDELDKLLVVIAKYPVDGMIISNLTKNRNNNKISESSVPENGGMSGKVVEVLSNNMIEYVYKKTSGKYLIIGCGGVFSAEDAYKKIKLGATLIQMITGMIFEGPQVIGEINRGLVKLLKKDGYSNIHEAVGKNVKF
jgi:dihydroorotate dehydrogenase